MSVSSNESWSIFEWMAKANGGWPSPYSSKKEAWARGYRTLRPDEYGGERIVHKGTIMARGARSALSRTEWRKRGCTIKPHQEPHHWLWLDHEDIPMLVEYPVYRDDQVEPIQRSTNDVAADEDHRCGLPLAVAKGKPLDNHEWAGVIEKRDAAVAEKCMAIAKKHTPWKASVRYRKTLSGCAWPFFNRLSAPRPVTRTALCTYLHECAHIILHKRDDKPTHVQEYEAERWAISKMRESGLVVPRYVVDDGRRYVRDIIYKDLRMGVRCIDGKVRCYARVSARAVKAVINKAEVDGPSTQRDTTHGQKEKQL